MFVKVLGKNIRALLNFSYAGFHLSVDLYIIVGCTAIKGGPQHTSCWVFFTEISHVKV